jgi:hypothetical protein
MHLLATARACTVFVVLALVGASGCGAATAPPVAAPTAAVADARATATAPAREGRIELPALLESLRPTPAQRRALLEPRLEPMADAGRELALAGAQAATRCDANAMALTDAAEFAVIAGEQVRGDVLDGIDRLHAILTAAQRKALVSRLLGDAHQTDDPRSTDEGARSLGGALHLSLGQMVTLLTRAGALRSAIEERIEPWRVKAKNALLAFPNDDFAIRNYGIAEVPAVELATRFVRDAFRTMLPILDREQCKALGGFIREAVEKQGQPGGPPGMS